MNVRKFSILFLFCLLNVLPAMAQSGNGTYLRSRVVPVSGPELIRDSLTILPSSITLTSIRYPDTLDTDAYKVDNTSIFLEKAAANKYQADTLRVQYRVLPYNFGRKHYRLDSAALAATDDVIKTGYELKLDKKGNTIIGSDRLKYDGSLSRGFSIGNKQSLVLNSDFNLQMAGMISDDIEVMAALTDANIPIQAEGNTHQLNEFDRVFIQLRKNEHRLMAGDLDIKNPRNYFSRYHKKLKGVMYSDLFSFSEKKVLETNASYAISKGKFARNELTSQEGNQGPYKLVGGGGERFLIILSGTEKVFLNGELLRRGSEYDYVIDYNLAEISFTFNRMISKDSRIIVEFEYVDQNYLRSLQTLSSGWKTSKSEVYFTFFNEQDSKNTLGNVELDTADIRILEMSGDGTEGATRSGIRSIINDAALLDAVLYRKVFLPEAGDSILVYTEYPDSARYTAYFSDVGELNGSYRIKSESTVNGRVYEYVGAGQGRYEPIIKLVAPERKQLFTLGLNQKLGEGALLTSEMGLSNYDKNRFSSLGNQDDWGAAALVQLDINRAFLSKRDSTLKISSKSSIIYEFTNKQFNPLNPYRNAEFNRDWNLESSLQRVDQHLLKVGSSFQRGQSSLAYQFSGFYSPAFFSGQKHSPVFALVHKGLQIKLQGDFLWSESQTEKTEFLRPKFELKQKIPFFNNAQIGFSYDVEQNKRNDINRPDTLKNNSFFFDNYKIFLNANASSGNHVQLFFNQRTDYFPSGSIFTANYHASDAGVKGLWKAGALSSLNYSLSYRNLSIDSILIDTKIKPTTTLLGKIEHALNAGGGFLRSKLLFDLQSGQEARSEYIFIELTNPGEGNYIWIDENQDGIQQKGEFEASPFSDEANFIKIVQYNNEFIRVNNGMLNHTLSINPRVLFRPVIDRPIYRFVSKFSFTSILRMDQKISESNRSGFRIPLFSIIPDSMLVSYNSFGNFTFFFNKSDPVYDLQFNTKISNIRHLQLDGLVENGSFENMLRGRYTFRSTTDIILSGSRGSRNYFAELYPTKNYQFDFSQIESEIKIRSSRKTGIQLLYRFVARKNSIGMNESLSGNVLSGKLNLRNYYNFNISASFSFARYDYSGTPNTSIELAMLEGLKNGNNYLWTVQLTRKMNQNIDISLRYEGRKTGMVKTVHIANMQAKARF